MDIQWIRDAVENIRELVRDNEKAHSLEDDLWEEVLNAIACGASNPQELAREALKTQEIEFNRWTS